MKFDIRNWSWRDGGSCVDDVACLIEESFLTEKCHVSDTFNEFVHDIIGYDFDDYRDDYGYTGWNFTDKTCCKMNDDTVGYPIFLCVVDDMHYPNVMSVADRVIDDERWNNIYITLNLAKLPKKSNGDIEEIDARSALFHECRHCLEMYITDHNTISDNVYKAFNDPFVSKHSATFINKCARTVDLFVRSEQNARIDAAVHYLLQYGMLERNDVSKLIEKTREHNLLYLMEEELDYMRETIKMYDRHSDTKTETETETMKERFDLCVVIGYIYQKYGGGKYIRDFSSVGQWTYKVRYDFIIKLVIALSDNKRTYLHRLMKALYVHVMHKSSDHLDIGLTPNRHKA